ncbi:MAG: hypothetical protein P1Q69_16975, partial [Candidatus Thorarchaeota archaeon]|nr:hypothetical protein [Candidatus Thorarchaeota archaeon]
MRFWYTEKVAYLILILALALPFVITLQIISEDSYTIQLLSGLWQYIVGTPDYVHFAISPFALIFILWYGLGVYIAKVAYDATKIGNWMRYDYAIRIVIVVVIQIGIMLLIPPVNGSPPVTNIPLPFAG